MKIFAFFLAPLMVFSSELFAREILPVEAFAGLPDVRGVKLSPNAEKLAFLESINTGSVVGTAVRIIDLETGESTYPLLIKNKTTVLNYIRWANDKTLLTSARFPTTRNGVDFMQTRMVKINAETGEQEPLLGLGFWSKNDRYPIYQDQIIDFLPDEPNKLLLGLRVDPPKLSVYKIDLNRNDKREFISTNKEYAYDWTTDRDHNIRVGYWYNNTTYEIKHRPLGEKRWETLWEFEAFSDEAVWPLGFDQDPNMLFVRAYHQGKYAIFKVNLANENLSKELVLHDPNYDVSGSLLYSNVKNKVVGITHSSDGGFTFWDPDYQSLQEGLDSALPGTSNLIVDISEDERSYVLLATNDTNPGSFYLGNRDTGQLHLIAHQYSDLKPEALAEKQTISYTARDGLDIEAFLTLPTDFSSDQDEPIPAIVFPHGGPIARDDDGFDYWTQLFANRGYAVLQMNFRGSAGYGFDFMQSGLKNWGLEMQNDIEDGTQFLIESGIADPKKICVVGASYGGYAALMEAAKNTDTYQCAVSFAGVTDIPRILRSKWGWSNYEIVEEQIGSDNRSLKQRSPVNLAEQMNIPILLAHGTEDRSVDINHGREMSKALARHNKDFIYLEQEDGNHYLSDELHRIEFFAKMDEFLQEHLQ